MKSSARLNCSIATVAFLALAGSAMAVARQGDADSSAGSAGATTEALTPARAWGPRRPDARVALAPPPKQRVADSEPTAFEGNALPVNSAFDLPPMVQLRLATDRAERSASLQKAVLQSSRLALAPAVRRALRDGRGSPEALQLLLTLARAESPLLVHTARGRTLRIQATSLSGTREIVRTAMEADGVGVKLRAVRNDFADLAQSPADARASNIGAKVVALALAQVGVPYSWGGGNANGASTGTCAGYTGSIQPCPATRTVGFDCSGLTLYVYAQVGVTLDHYAAFQFLEGRRIASTELLPGDLVFFNPKSDGPGHMGMYLGSGNFVHAPRTGDFVKISPLTDYASSYMGAVRPY